MICKLAGSVAFVLLASVPAFASDAPVISVAGVTERTTNPTPSGPGTPITFTQAPLSPSRGALLPSLYVSLAALNAYDGFTTMTGVAQGAIEANSLMRGVAASPIAMVAIKSGITAGSILMAERLWKSGHRGHAIGMMLATNALMVAVTARNSTVLRRQR